MHKTVAQHLTSSNSSRLAKHVVAGSWHHFEPQRWNTTHLRPLMPPAPWAVVCVEVVHTNRRIQVLTGKAPYQTLHEDASDLGQKQT